jgi:hypothetical protein
MIIFQYLRHISKVYSAMDIGDKSKAAVIPDIVSPEIALIL